MNVSATIPKSAWLPLTPRGVAAFASARLSRLLLVQFIFALMSAAVVGWFLAVAWAPTIRDAIDAVPVESRISGGALQWSGESPVMLAEGPYLGFAVDLDHASQVNASSHLVIELGRTDWQMSSIFGVLHVPWLINTRYPQGYTIALNRTELGPWWGAREPFLIGFAMALTVPVLMITWAGLGLLYLVPVWLVAFYGNRAVNWRGCLRLAGAALMPGALFMSAALVFYGLGAFDLLRLALAFVMHFVVGWFYLVVSPTFLPRHPAALAAGKNPFAPGGVE